jgi:hypothetical protein
MALALGWTDPSEVRGMEEQQASLWLEIEDLQRQLAAAEASKVVSVEELLRLANPVNQSTAETPAA